jgi:hypothetical protein
MMFFKNKLEFYAVVLIVIPCAIKACDAETRAQGFSSTKKGGSAPVVVQPRGKPKLVKTILVNEESLPTQQGAVTGVEKIDVFENPGIMKVTFFIFNKGKHPISIHINKKETTLSDPRDGETYEPQAFEPLPDRGGYMREVKPNSRIRWWFSYKLPTVTTTSLTVHLKMNGGFVIDENMFESYDISFDDFLGPAPAPKPEAEMEKPGPKAKDAAPVPPGADDGDPPPPAEKPKAAPKVSIIYEGGTMMDGKVGAPVGIELTSTPEEGEPLTGRMYSTRSPKLCGPLTGQVVSEPSTREGVAFVLLDQAGNSIRFVPDGKLLSGTSSNGMKFTLKRVEPKRSAKGK